MSENGEKQLQQRTEDAGESRRGPPLPTPDELSPLFRHADGLRPAPGVHDRALDDLRHALVASFRSGQLPGDIGPVRQTPPVSGANIPYDEPVPGKPIRVARRDSEIRDAGLPEWALGMQPSRSIGPFIDAVGARVAFDVFDAQAHVRVFHGPLEIVELPSGSALDEAGTSLTLPAGTVWILGSRLTASAPASAWVGVLIKSGTLAFPAGALFLDGTLVAPGASTLTLTLELDPPIVPAPAAGPGSEAGHSDVDLSETATFSFIALDGLSIAADTASLTVFGNALVIERSAAAPYYEPALSMLIVPMAADVASIGINAVQSTLFQPTGQASIARAGWGLPVTIAPPENLGTAIGCGALVLELEPGLEATWDGLRGGPTVLGRTLVAADPALLKIVATAAVNLRGEHTLELWRERESESDRSILNVQYPRPFLLWLVSQRDGLDAVLAEGHLSGHFDRPLTVDGSRFPVEFNAGLGILQKSDGTTVFSEAGAEQGTFRPILAAALSNALLTVTPPQSLFFNGSLRGGIGIEGGTREPVVHHAYLSDSPAPAQTRTCGEFRSDVRS